MNNSTTRFSERVEDYMKYRPSYPPELIALLKKELHLDPVNIVADIGSGTGISSMQFIENGNLVYGVEPNREMRIAGEQILKDCHNFISIAGTAEATTLKDQSIDIIFCGQAFHWFEKAECKKEFRRILTKNGHQVFVWNSRSLKSNFQIEYENTLFENIEEYRFVNHRNISENDIRAFFEPKMLSVFKMNNKQVLNLEAVKGRLKSSSYCPKFGKPLDKLMLEIETIFHKYKINDTIELAYEVKIYCC